MSILTITEYSNDIVTVVEKEIVVQIADFDTGAGAIPVSTITAKGALIAGLAANDPTALAVGTDGQILTANSSEESGLKWVTPTGSSVVSKQIWVGGWKPLITGGCGVAQLEVGTYKNPVEACAFDQTTPESAYVNFVMPQDYTGGTINATLYWAHPTPSDANYKVSWSVKGVALTNGDAIGETNYGTAVVVNDEGGTATDLYITDQTAAITLSGTAPDAGQFVQLVVKRVADDATNDTLTGDAYLIGAMILYPVE